MKHLIKIQTELKAPKSQYNKFGGYNYRNCEDILEAVKPLCEKYGCLLNIMDKVVLIGERYYVEATACIRTPENTFSVTAYAREEQAKKGMDGSQITGAASSYARKYALNGLFCIDDTKDADSSKPEAEKQKQEPPKNNNSQKVTKAQAEEIVSICDKHHKKVDDMCKYFKAKVVEDLTVSQYHEVKKIFKED